MRTALVIAGFVLGAIVRIALLPVPGSPDVASWKTWTFAASTDATSLYGVGGNPPERRLIHWRGTKSTTEYPPLALYELAVVGRVYRAIDPTYDDTPLLTALVKMPGVIAEITLVMGLLVWGRRRFGPQAATWTAMAIWLNPAVILNGAALGYLDAQMAAPALLAFVAAAGGFPAAAGALTAAAVLTKAQALFIAPVILLVAMRKEADLALRFARLDTLAKRNLRSFVLGGAVTATVIVLPIVLRGAWPNMVQAVSRLASHDMLSGYALNAWWLVTWFLRAVYALHLGWFQAFTMPVRILGRHRFMEIAFVDPKLIGAGIVGVLVVWALWRSGTRRSLSVWAATAGWCVFAYFMFAAQVHENHLYLAVPFFALAAGLERRFRAPFYTVSAICAINMYVFYGIGDGRPLPFERGGTVLDLTVILSLVNLALFGWVTSETRGTGLPDRNADVDDD
ncbi:MAG TPA: hypothetical protein VES67_19000 [Vicinamibacterales bacterium]|nr:hypothetical protein [Vicinamibacterales bacterium]